MAKKKTFFQKHATSILVIGFILMLGIFISLSSLQKQHQEEQLVFGDDEIKMYYFHLRTCPHCHEQNKFHPTLLAKYPNVHIIKYEMSEPGSYQKYQEMASEIEGLDPNNFPGTPLTIINGKFNIGFGSADTTGQKLLAMIEEEQEKIEENWDETKVRTLDLRLQHLESQQ
jgi:glutaredoxin